MTLRILTALAALIAVPAGVATAAPEAAIQYDLNKTLILDGVVQSVDWSGDRLTLVFRWNNGHRLIDFNVVGPKPADLLKMGWTRAMLKPQDRLDAVVHPDKSGKPNGLLMRFYLRDGSTMELSPIGTTQVIPRDALEMRFKNPADDPMAGYYGNTQDFYATDPKGPIEANYNGRSWYNSDHTLVMFSTDLQPDGSWARSLNYGTWWLEEFGGEWTRCMIFNFSKMPFCHSPVGFEKIGDKWTAPLSSAKGSWTEHRELQKGRF